VAGELGVTESAVVQAKFRILKRLREEAGGPGGVAPGPHFQGVRSPEAQAGELGHAGMFLITALVALFWQGRRARFLADLLRRAKRAEGDPQQAEGLKGSKLSVWTDDPKVGKIHYDLKRAPD
jgi:hypothetical protein